MKALALFISRKLFRYHSFIISVAGFALWVTGFFNSEDFFETPHVYLRISFLGLVGVIIIIKAIKYLKSSDSDNVRDFENALLALLIINIAIQFSGHYSEFLYPLNFILLALVVAYSTLLTGLLLATAILILEIAQAFFLDEFFKVSVFERIVFHFLMSLAFIVFVGEVIRLERRGRETAHRTLDKLRQDGSQLDPPKDAEGLGRISAEARERSNVNHLLLQDKMLGRLAEITRRALVAHSVVIMLLDIDSKYLSIKAYASEQDDIELGAIIELSQSAFAPAVESRQSIHLDRISVKKMLSYYKKNLKLKNMIICPMFRGKHVVGTVAADSLLADHFGSEEIEFLDLVATQVVENMDKVKLIRNTLNDREQFAAFYEVAHKVSTALKIEDVLEVVLSASSTIVGYDAAVLSFVGEKEPDKSTIYDVFNLSADKYKGQTFGHNEGLVGWVTHIKTYLSQPDLSNVQRPIFSSSIRIKGTQSLLCLPLTIHENAVGALTFLSSKKNAFSESDRKIMDVLALQAAISLENARIYEKMEQMAVTDGLTSLNNHRYFKDWLRTEIERTKRMPIEISLILMDIDHFKKVNDTYGHPVGDVVLQNVAGILTDSIRNIDLAARYGGEEFVLVLLDTNAKGAKKLAERIRKRIAQTKIQYPDGSLSISMSMGVSTYPENAKHAQRLVDLADKALYYSKENGRNRSTHIREIPAKETENSE